MNRKGYICLVVLIILTSGCVSRVPIASNHPLSFQKKAKASHHWELLAEDVVSQALVRIDKDSKMKKKMVYVLPPQDDTSFNRAFRNFLITDFVQRGVPVSSQKAGALEFSFDTQLVKHNSSRFVHKPGLLTVLTGGLWVLRDAVIFSPPAIAASMGLVAAADVGYSYDAGPQTQTELIVTSSISEDSSFVFRKSDIYYVESPDSDLFLEVGEYGLFSDVPPGLQRSIKKLEVTGK